MVIKIFYIIISLNEEKNCGVVFYNGFPLSRDGIVESNEYMYIY